ncbi:pyridoxal phosphate-dependent aminotransferase [Orrella daihaiensis]|uniref:Pyridoxal phosphate-dependent aminotransferase n=1 Tax=Orrella daihaiensis TaxID=2782176 RepID=A0ABY4APX4_9BURK|nr:pyridoxal phosphate-dependent aminotransferase [Orrella daihaiensis]UOD51115.1 pyridoxal phosphate-dependent aminotransferase [Orrella daihaiensis]
MTAQLAHRLQHTQTFHAMEIFKRTLALQSLGRDIISLGIGEPDFTAAPAVLEAMKLAADKGLGKYGPAAGIMPLREAIAQFYADQLGARVDPHRVIVTNGASGALLLASLALINPGQEVLMPDPCYPANSNFIMAAGGTTKLIRTEPERQFQLTAQDIRMHWTERTAGVLIASPGNPTGTSIEPDELRGIINAVNQLNGFVMMDEIYLGLSYRDKRCSALAIDDNLIILNSFSKYFHMTGWRLGWMIVPPELVAPIEKLASSLMICPPTLAQHGALACFEPNTIELLEHRREAFRARRDFLVQGLEAIGFDIPAKPDGAFYVYADISRFSNDSDQLVDVLLEKAGVALVPGIDFGPAHAKSKVRLAYTIGLDRLEDAVGRIDRCLNT